MPSCNSADETALVNRARSLIAQYDDMAEMIRLGAYQMGADPGTDEAIYFHDRLEAFLSQQQNERCGLDETYQMLAEILSDGQG
jgi:flagellum-specific ATP synthase